MVLIGLLFAFCSGFCCCSTIFVSIINEDKSLKDMATIISILLMVVALGCNYIN